LVPSASGRRQRRSSGRRRTEKELVVTKRGKPVAKIVPVEAPPSLVGSVRYSITDDELVHGSAWEGYAEDARL